MPKNDIVIYDNGEIELKASVNKDSIWLTQKQIAMLFDKERSVITKHIKKIFEDKEVDKKSNVQILHIANSDKPVTYYSLDIILAVGYRTNSSKAISFRKWATRVLKNYILDGYAINGNKITYKRFTKLEHDVSLLKEKMKLLEKENLLPKQGVFFNGQIFDAYKFVNDLIKSAKKSIILIDNYVDESVLVLFSKIPRINVTIYTRLNDKLKLDFEKYKQQYKNVEVIDFSLSHDRFLIIDKKDVYHIGASLKDLGKKWFAFSKLNLESSKLLSMLGLSPFKK